MNNIIEGRNYMMFKLTDKEQKNINEGAIFYTLFDLVYKIYRINKIKLLMKKLFVD